ncbi:MAG: thioredoxin-disulfide reductase [Clostridiaceae bacterium]|nr:thioredoxin-disulfide reductase [Clostridiaceae bacterium]
MQDLMIIGGGPAGLTAAIYAARAGVKPIVLESLTCGGQTITTSEIENYPAITKIEGWRFAEELRSQAEQFGTDIRMERVTGLSLRGETKVITTEKGEYEAKSVIIANGAKRRKLGCPGEEEFLGRGVSYCGVCDGNFFRGRTVCVIGGGNTALEDALYLSRICKKVYLIYRRAELRVHSVEADEVRAKENIELIFSSVPARIFGETRVEGIELRRTDGGENNQLAVDAVFVAVGLEPENAAFADCIALDEGGYILAGEDCATNVPGVYAAGDTRTKRLRQIITAASDGAVAATAATEYIRSAGF